MSATPVPSLAHSRVEDALALLIGILFVALGLLILKSAGLCIGGTAGIAFIGHFGFGLPFAAVFFAVNIPFFLVGWLAFGTGYLVKTVVATAALSALAGVLPPVFVLAHVEPLVAAVVGGLLIGMGMLALIRHRTGVGGVAILAVWLQQRFGWRAGWVQMAVDAAVVGAAFLVMEPGSVLLSIVASVLMNLVIAFYHKPGRYLGF